MEIELDASDALLARDRPRAGRGSASPPSRPTDGASCSRTITRSPSCRTSRATPTRCTSSRSGACRTCTRSATPKPSRSRARSRTSPCGSTTSGRCHFRTCRCCTRRRPTPATTARIISSWRSIRRCGGRTCSSTSPVRKSAAATSSATRRRKRRPPSCGAVRRALSRARVMVRDAERLLGRLRRIHAALRDAVVDSCERAGANLESLTAVVGNEAGDTIFALDRVSEEALIEHFDALAREWPMLLVAEGLGETGRRMLPDGATPEIVVIVDPIDGTRGLMYQKRPGWILTGVAPYRGDATSLADIDRRAADRDSAGEAAPVGQPVGRRRRAGGGRAAEPAHGRAHADRAASVAGARRSSRASASCRASSPDAARILAEIDDAIVERVLGELPPGRAVAFEDQYISSAGQLYELMMGHDRWTADLRPLVWAKRRSARALLPSVRSRAPIAIARAAGVDRDRRPRPAARRAAGRRDRRRLDRLRQRRDPRPGRAGAAAASGGTARVTIDAFIAQPARTIATSSIPPGPSSSRARRAGSISWAGSPTTPDRSCCSCPSRCAAFAAAQWTDATPPMVTVRTADRERRRRLPHGAGAAGRSAGGLRPTCARVSPPIRAGAGPATSPGR